MTSWIGFPHPDRDSGWTNLVTKVLMSVFVIELVLGGPGYWSVSGISIRRTIVALITLWLLILWALGRARLRLGHIFLLASIALVMAIWVLLLPALHGPQRFADGVQEGFPLALLFTGVLTHAYYRDNPRAWTELRRVAGYSLAAVAMLALAVWVVGTFVVEDAVLVALGFLNYFTLGNENLEPSIYVQRMPDGFFRVMWITSTLFITGLLYSVCSGRRVAALLFATALLVSYTRALWLCAAMGIAFAIVRNAAGGRMPRIRPVWLALVVVAAGMLVAWDFAQDVDDSIVPRVANRLVTTFSDESASDRVDQVDPLLDAWLASPVFGAGMGSTASVSRSDVAPYMYELTYLALLMKMGIVGLFGAGALVGALMIRPAPKSSAVGYIDASIVAFLLACATNPYLLNLVGLALLSFLFIDRDILARLEWGAKQFHPRLKRLADSESGVLGLADTSREFANRPSSSIKEVGG